MCIRDRPDTISAQQIRTIALSKEVNLRYFKNGDVGMTRAWFKESEEDMPTIPSRPPCG